jgi:hypothetical protein
MDAQCGSRLHSYQTKPAWEPDDTSFGSFNSYQLPSVASLTGTMSIPSPTELPDAFLEHLKSLGLDPAVTTFIHYQKRPVLSPGGRYDEAPTQEWCERMDSLLVSAIQFPNIFYTYCFQSKLTRVMSSQPTHQELVITITGLCSDGISELEAGLKSQMESDKAAREEEERAKAEAVRLAEEAARLAEEAAKLAVQRAEMERVERIKKLEQDRIEIDTAERELAAKKRAWIEAHPLPDDDEANEDSVEEEDEEEVNDSAAEEVSTYCSFMLFNTHNIIQCLRGLARSPSATWKGTPAAKLPRDGMMW